MLQAWGFQTREEGELRVCMASRSHTAAYWRGSMDWQRDRERSGCSVPSQGTVILGPFDVVVQSGLWEVSSGLPHPERGWMV